MKKQINNKLAVLIIFILVVIILVALYYAKNPEGPILEDTYEEVTTKVVVVKVEDNGGLLVIDDNTKYPSLYYIGAREGENYKQGNELLVHYNGMSTLMYPQGFSGLTKIEFVKEKSDIEIPESILRQCYSSKENIRVTIHEISDSGIALSIVDANKYPYNYSHNYKINKKVKNKDYKEKGEIIGENTKNTIAGYTRNRSRICLGRSK